MPKERGLTIAICIIFAMGNSTILPCFSLKGFSQQGLVVSPFSCLTDYSSTMILRLSLLWGDLYFPGPFPCLLRHRPRVTDSLPNSSRIRAQFYPSADKKCFLFEHTLVETGSSCFSANSHTGVGITLYLMFRLRQIC